MIGRLNVWAANLLEYANWDEAEGRMDWRLDIKDGLEMLRGIQCQEWAITESSTNQFIDVEIKDKGGVR